MAKNSNGGMGEFFKVNGEKIGFGVIVLIALLLIVFSFTGKSLPSSKSPKSMISAAESTAAAIENTKPVPNSVPAVRKRVENKMKLSKEEFRIAPFDNILREERAKRKEPVFLAAEKLEITPGHGAFNYKGVGAEADPDGDPPILEPGTGDDVVVNPAPGSVAEGRYYVVIKGLIPYDDQVEAYNQVFAHAIRPPPLAGAKQDQPTQIDHRMTPVYKFFNLQRVELKPGETVDKIEWEKVKVIPARQVGIKEQTERNAWATKPADPVHSKLLVPGINPLLLSDKWRGVSPKILNYWKVKDLCHSELLDINKRIIRQETDPELEQPMEQEPDVFGLLRNPQAKKSAQHVQLMAQVEKKLNQKRLFRYVDYDVQPGKRYAYRVQLNFMNPNSGLNIRFIEKLALASGKFRSSPWSQSSPVAEIAADENVYVGGVHREKRYNINGGPSVKLNGVQWLNSGGYYVSKSFVREIGRARNKKNVYVMRSQLLDFAAPASYINPITGASARSAVGVATKNILVDFRGGKDPAIKKPSPIVPPEMVLLLNSQGRLEIHYPEDDKIRYDKYGGTPGGGAEDNSDDSLEDLDDESGQPKKGSGGIFD